MIRIKNWIQSSLSRIFISILLFLYLITIIAAVYAFIGSSGKISKNYINRFVKAQNQLEKNKLIALLERELTLSQKLADDPAIIKWIQNENNSSQMLLAEEQLTSYHKLIETSSQFIAIKSSNHFYLGNIRTPGKVLVEGTSADRWFYEALNAEKDYSLNVNYDNLLNKVMVWINVLVRDKDGNAIAVAGSGIDLSGFLEKLLLHDEKGVSTVIINSLGQIQAHPDRSIVEHNGRAKQDSDKIKIYDLLKNPKDHELIKQAIASLNDNAQPVQLRLNIHDKKSIVAIGHIPHIDWYNMVIVDEDSLIGVKDFVPLGMVFLISLILMLISI
ncbi:MAG: cache domain-containing protein, partial [Candidatus Cloacimonetes bacterium]|nr:cache domain-containing protein [Candidatus Cloacimonadota bacterium]